MTSDIRLLTTLVIHHLLTLRRPHVHPDGDAHGSGLSARWRRVRNDAGYTTETVIVTGLLLAAGLTVLGIVTAKIIAKAQSLDFG